MLLPRSHARQRWCMTGVGGRIAPTHLRGEMGDPVRLAIVEFSDNGSAAATTMRASALGAFARFETHPLMTAQEAQRAMQMVKDCAKAYRAPNA